MLTNFCPFLSALYNIVANIVRGDGPSCRRYTSINLTAFDNNSSSNVSLAALRAQINEVETSRQCEIVMAFFNETAKETKEIGTESSAKRFQESCARSDTSGRTDGCRDSSYQSTIPEVVFPVH